MEPTDVKRKLAARAAAAVAALLKLGGRISEPAMVATNARVKLEGIAEHRDLLDPKARDS